VIPDKEHPIKNLIRRQKIESTKGTNKSMSCSCFSWTILLVGSLLEITLAPGQSTDVPFKLDAQAFRHFDEASNSWVVTPGRYQTSLLSEEAHPVYRVGITLVAK